MVAVGDGAHHRADVERLLAIRVGEIEIFAPADSVTHSSGTPSSSAMSIAAFPSEERIREAQALGRIDHFVVSCPKDIACVAVPGNRRAGLKSWRLTPNEGEWSE
jgi:hypothetical protein